MILTNIEVTQNCVRLKMRMTFVLRKVRYGPKQLCNVHGQRYRQYSGSKQYNYRMTHNRNAGHIIISTVIFVTLCDNAWPNETPKTKSTHIVERKKGKRKATAATAAAAAAARVKKNAEFSQKQFGAWMCSNSQKTPIWDFSKVSLCVVAIDFSRSTVDANVCSIGQFAYTVRTLHG